ncbi:MAG: glycerol-3-phosphate dehydrogenase [Geminicoccaceae bacterium]|jgi:glycerol-3-phosphate dehydrogenase|nr:glycerol-3-phosphate dehydrogenase [Geminicoccaceae bacterium]MCE3246503.1 glycerol-3-phosphate dehydrogenase [Geminicoccaceae bacterium]MDF2765350.1 glycerol-3-phosphate dehydrogenase [Rhodospirillales bacterium]
MRRDLRHLDGTIYDLLVVGAGIHGACVARDAAMRGLRVALVEQGDFGNATSHNSFKLIHGGLRYLQHLDLRRVRESIEERRFWLQAAPHLIRPLKFVMATRGHGTRGREALWLALRAHDVIGSDRNRRLLPSQQTPSGRLISKKEYLRLVPSLAPSGLTGGAIWYDAQMEDADRVLLECVLAAAGAGTAVANYLTIDSLTGTATDIVGVRARDLLDGSELEIRARVTVNACGPWSGDLLRRAPRDLSEGHGLDLTKGMNLVTRKLFDGYAVAVVSRRISDAVLGRGQRLYFITPWYDCSVIGTVHLPYKGHPERCRFAESEVAAFLDEVNDACPGACLTLDDVRYCYGGLTPAEGMQRGEVKRARRSIVIDHQRTDAMAGLVSVVGVKYTTARLVAEHTVDLVFRKLSRTPPPPCTVRHVPLIGAQGFEDSAALNRQIVGALNSDVEQDGTELLKRYGSIFAKVLQVGAKPAPQKSLREILYCCCLHAVREEMAVSLKDLVFLRTNLAARGRLPEGFLSSCADMMQAELGWSMRRKESEVAAAQAHAAARFCAVGRSSLVSSG